MIHITEKNAAWNNVPALVDFELDAFANLELEVTLEQSAELEIVLGEVRTADGRVNRAPGGFRSVRIMRRHCPAGVSHFRFDMPKHRSPYAHTISVPTPPETDGEVTPFRYVEISGGTGRATLRRRELYGDFDDAAAHFECDNRRLNELWEFCRYSIKATSGFGKYIDGERERMPYEGDAYINQLGHFCCDADYEIARNTIEHFFEHGDATWPLEWLLLTPQLVRDYLAYSGDTASVAQWCKRLPEKLSARLAGDDGLLRGAEPVLELIDWPAGERDDYEFGKVNFVPNCYYYNALLAMAELSGDRTYIEKAAHVRGMLRRLMLKNGRFVDNPESGHTALHSAFFALRFGIAEPAEQPALAALIRAKGMACSVYGAQFLLESCYMNGLADHAFALLNSIGKRSWQNMRDCGATITMEAWDNSCKPNQDWTHAWGAAPANIIPRWLCGVRPAATGFDAFTVTPAPGPLRWFKLTQPTRHGAINVEYDDGQVTVSAPPGVPRLQMQNRKWS